MGLLFLTMSTQAAWLIFVSLFLSSWWIVPYSIYIYVSRAQHRFLLSLRSQTRLYRLRKFFLSWFITINAIGKNVLNGPICVGYRAARPSGVNAVLVLGSWYSKFVPVRVASLPLPYMAAQQPVQEWKRRSWHGQAIDAGSQRFVLTKITRKYPKGSHFSFLKNNTT